MKRFYRQVTTNASAAGWQVFLDNRPILTQAGNPQIVPNRLLAEALADEWRGQGDKIDPRAFPLRDLADLALDHIAPDRTATIAKLLAFAETDTLCYRAHPDEPLHQRQQEVWEPVLKACEDARGIRFERISGVIHRPQKPSTLATLCDELSAQSDFALAALYTLASVSASLIAALAVADDPGAAEAIFAAANLEEDWQAQNWGRDEEADKARAARLAAFMAAARFLALSQDDRGL